MAHIAAASYSDSLGIENFLIEILHQLELQGQDPIDDFLGGHPDPVIRRCYRALRKIFDSPLGQKYLEMVTEVSIRRSGINDVHFVNLWFRSIQYVFKSRQDDSYLQFSEDDWFSYFTGRGIGDLPEVKELLFVQNTATHVLGRYRSLAAMLRLQQNSHFNLRVADIGCSLGLGLKAALTPGYLKSDCLVDHTPKSIIESNLDSPVNNCSLAIGIDIRLPDIDWVKSCNYPSNYQADAAAIDKAVSELSACSAKVCLYEADILNPTVVKLLNPDGIKLNMVYSSMSLYELTISEQDLAQNHISHALEEGGLFINFTLINPKNWFLGNKTTVSQKVNGNLLPPLEWLLWKDSRCREVSAGSDFNRVMSLLVRSQQ